MDGKETYIVNVTKLKPFPETERALTFIVVIIPPSPGFFLAPWLDRGAGRLV